MSLSEVASLVTAELESEPVHGAEPPSAARRETLGLGVLFGAMYFIQGIGDPTDGLVAQPINALLKSWGHTSGAITGFAALLSIPWVLKPLYGLLSDFLPVRGSYRKSYLLLTTGATVLGMLVLYVVDLPHGAWWLLLGLLWIPAVGVAFSDVVVDALMVEKGQPRGITGSLQSVQWASLYAAMILSGWLGGYLSQHGLQKLGFVLCAAVTAVTLLLTWRLVRETPRPAAPRSMRAAVSSLARAARTPGVWCAGGFLFLWNFNPFSTTVLYVHMTGPLGMSEQFYGTTVSLLAVASVVASVCYGFYCRRVPFGLLVHLSIVLGILATIAYWAMFDERSAVLVTLAVGFTYMTACLVQLDLAARICPLETAGTVFALLMALENLGISASTAVGGWMYEKGAAWWGPRTSFNVLVGIGALVTAGCWLLVPALRRYAVALRAPDLPAPAPACRGLRSRSGEPARESAPAIRRSP